MSDKPKSYKKNSYFLTALDPVHVGAGSYRIGLVDNTIIREPHTNLPKIPGTSIAGKARAYAALKCDEKQTEEVTKINSRYLNCSGKGGSDGKKHCGKLDCPVCTAFGFAKGNDKDGSSFKGLASFSDAHLAFFPVHTSMGPVWATCPDLLGRMGANCEDIDYADIFSFNEGPVTPAGLNLGWRWFKKGSGHTFTVPIVLPENIKQLVKQKGVIISNYMFTQVVNDSLEVRTSVAIDPMTGAAETGALYSYEALPRTTILRFDITVENPVYFRIKEKEIKLSMADIMDNAESGLKTYLPVLGIGGMGTRGMGRMKMING